MAVLRKAHKSNFTVIDNQVFKSNLSLKARGLLSTMLSLPDNWNFSTAGLTSILPSDGESVIRSAIKELESGGYLTRERIRDDKGKIIDWLWTFSDYPQDENPHVENRAQLSTKQSNTDGESKKGANTDEYTPAPAKAAPEKKGTYGRYANVKLTDVDLSKLKTEFPADWQERIDRLSTYMDSTGKSYKNHLATIRNWARRDAERAASSTKPPAPEPGRREMTPEDVMAKHGVDYFTAQEMLCDGTY